MIEIKHIGIESISKIKKIAHETWPNTFGQLMPKEQIDNMLDLIYNETSLKNQMLNKGHNFILVEEDNHLLGFSSYEVNYNYEMQLMIHKIYLVPASQGLGLGKRLINFLSDIARQNQNTTLRLKVYYENFKAIGFYEKYGFRKVGTEITDIGNNYEILDNVMVKEL